jgi:predicted GH43/DUF377 family glycosyl hydrolase
MDPSRRPPTPSLFERRSENPIIEATDLPFAANAVFNPGAARLGSETVLLLRVEDLRGISHLQVARSDDGVTGWRYDDRHLLTPDPGHPEEIWGCEDPRLTWLAEREEWAIAYTAYSRRGPLVSLAVTTDFHTARRLDRSCRRRTSDAASSRRSADAGRRSTARPYGRRSHLGVVLAGPPPLGRPCPPHEARDGAWWDAGKIGLGPPPIETDEGWLVMYHGVHLTAAGPIYRVGLALLDLDDPTVVVRRSEEWVLGPRLPYERAGDVDQVVFPCGWTVDVETGRLNLYYGAADTSVARHRGLRSGPRVHARLARARTAARVRPDRLSPVPTGDPHAESAHPLDGEEPHEVDSAPRWH